MKLFVVVEYFNDTCKIDKHYFGNERTAQRAAEARVTRLRERNTGRSGYTAHVLVKKATRIKGNYIG